MEKFYYSVSIPVPVRKDFTYFSEEKIQAGSRVKVSFNKRKVVGLVCKQTSKPDFKTTSKVLRYEGTKSQMIDYVKDIAAAIRKGGFENIEKYADKFEKDALKSLDPEKELNKIPKINRSQVANLLNMSFTEKAPNTQDAMKRYKAGKAGFTDKAHLKAKGLIPRADGTKRKSDKYK